MLSPYIIIIIIVIIGLFIAGSSYSRLIKTYNRYNKRHAYVNITAAQFTVAAFQHLGLKNHRIALTDKPFGDAYIASKNVVLISHQNADNKSVSAIAVAAHEIGHAIQHKEAYGLFSLNYLFQVIDRISSWVLGPCLLVGGWMYLFSPEITLGTTLLYIALGLGIASLTLKIITIPLELNASSRGLKLLRNERVLDSDELKQAKKVLNAAALTYVGGLFSTLLRALRAVDRSFK